MDYKQIQKICKLTQSQLKGYVTRKLESKYDNVTVGDGYVYAQGEFPVLLVAHMDTVHKERVTQIMFDNNTMYSPQGIGGDDRCGVYAILKITDKIKCSVLFTEDEETGGIGADKFCVTSLADELVGKFNYIIELDRKGKNDAVFYDCDNKEFTDFITREFYKEAYGTFSDISYVAPKLYVAAVNLSCGYYKPHTTNEYIALDELDECIRQVLSLLARTTMTDKYEYIEAKYKYRNYKAYNNYYNDWDNDWYGYNNKSTYAKKCYHILYRTYAGKPKQESFLAFSKDEALGKFFAENALVCYSDVCDVIEEWY